MTVRREGKGIDFTQVIKELDKLNHYQVAVGFFGSNDAKLLQIVRANEYGAYIRPKKGEYLYVPYKKKDGSKGVYKLKSVRIPSRPFIRNAWENNKGKYRRLLILGIQRVTAGKLKAFDLLNQLGQECVKDIQESAVKLDRPKNAPLTVENKGSDNPLVDTGELQRKCTYKIVKI